MIYLLRHGMDDEKYIGGHSNLPLLEEGITQVEGAANFIKDGNYKIEGIISSDIKRAKQTANIVGNILNKDIEYTSLLRELDKGTMTGMLKKNADIYYPEYKNLDDVNLRYPSGESMRDFYNRIFNSLDKILSMDNKLLITHRGVINMLYFILNNKELNMDKKQFGVTHASFHELDPINKTIRKIR